jgi:putative aldouronate transport system substrate-binding protein
MRRKKQLLLIIVLSLLIVSLSACQKTPSKTSTTQKGGSTPADIIEPVTVKGFGPFSPAGDAPEIESWNDQILWKEVPKRTGVTVEWEHVASAEWTAQLGLVMASGDLPDLIHQVNPVLAGQYGVQGALRPLQDLIKEHAPNLQKLLDENPSVKGQITSPDGNIYFFPRMLLDPKTQCFVGWAIRKGWVDEVGKEMPSTLDELYDVLKAIKEKHPERYPYLFDPRPFIWEFGVGSRGPNNNNDFFIEDNQIKYGPKDPRYKEAVTYLNKLYSEGLIDPEYLTINSGWSDEGLGRVTQEIGGLVVGSWAGFLTRFNQTLAADGKEADFVAMRPPGEGNLLGRHNSVDAGVGGVITSTSEYAVEITRMFDYLCSEEGRLLVNFGLEGDTYNMIDGKPVYTDKVTKHPTLGILAYCNNYIGNVSTWPTVLMPESYIATLSDPEALEGNRMVAEEYSDDIKTPTLQFTDEERARVQELERDINTFIDENLHAFIMGDKDLSQFDDFLSVLDKMNVDELIQIYTTAYDRYKEVIGE